jgi:hypothetical protein
MRLTLELPPFSGLRSTCADMSSYLKKENPFIFKPVKKFGWNASETEDTTPLSSWMIGDDWSGKWFEGFWEEIGSALGGKMEVLSILG